MEREPRRRRPNRTAAERRAQYARANGRAVMRLLHAFTEVEQHRGQGLTRLASALRQALVADHADPADRVHPEPPPGPAPEGDLAGASPATAAAAPPPSLPPEAPRRLAALGRDSEAVPT
eukprot:2766558-Pyramimonas_sp.AAC.1